MRTYHLTIIGSNGHQFHRYLRTKHDPDVLVARIERRVPHAAAVWADLL